LSLSSPKCILVVDDEESIRDVIGETLELEGYRVAKAANGRAALILIKASRPDAIVLDLMMPGMDGWGFLEVCRTDELCASTPILVISAYRKLAEIASSLGVQACLEKPFDLDVFLRAIERLLAAPPAPNIPN
jgi:CheY-like chemotaxis protein